MGKTKKLALIVSGGGMKCSYGAGSMTALVEEYGLTKPDILICGSGSAGTGTYYVGEHYQAIKDVWTDLLSSKEMIKGKWFPQLNIDFLVDEIFKKKFPFDKNKVRDSKTTYFIPVLNRENGSQKYFSNKEDVDLYEVMRATKSLPIFSKLDPKIKINDSYYCDSLLTSGTKTHFKKAVEEGASKILIINNSPEELKNNTMVLAFNLWIRYQGFGENYYSLEKNLLKYNMPETIKIMEIKPKENLTISTLTNNKDELTKTFNQGYKETLKNKKLEKFLEGFT